MFQDNYAIGSSGSFEEDELTAKQQQNGGQAFSTIAADFSRRFVHEVVEQSIASAIKEQQEFKQTLKNVSASVVEKIIAPSGISQSSKPEEEAQREKKITEKAPDVEAKSTEQGGKRKAEEKKEAVSSLNSYPTSAKTSSPAPADIMPTSSSSSKKTQNQGQSDIAQQSSSHTWVYLGIAAAIAGGILFFTSRRR